MNEHDDGYRAPRAGLQSKGHIIYEDARAFALKQRLNPLRYACYIFTSFLITILVIAIVMALFAAKGMNDYAVVSMGFFALIWFVYYVTLTIRRLHDMDQSGWLWLLIFVPSLSTFFAATPTLMYAIILFGPLFNLYLMAGGGTRGMNRFGTPCPPNGPLVMFFGGLYWVVTVLILLLNFTVMALAFFAPEMIANIPGLAEGVEEGQAVQEAIRRALGK